MKKIGGSKLLQIFGTYGYEFGLKNICKIMDSIYIIRHMVQRNGR